MRVTGEVVILTSFLFFSIIFLYVTFTEVPVTPRVIINERVWPAILLISILVSVIPLLYGTLKKPQLKLEAIKIRKFLSILIFAILYILLLSPLGFFIATLILSSLYFYLVGVNIIKSIIIGVLLAFTLIITFPVIFMVPLPKGEGIFYDITSIILGFFGK